MKRLRWIGLAALGAVLTGCATGAYLDAAKGLRSRNPHASIEYLALVLKNDPANGEAILLADEIGKEIAGNADTKIRDYERAKKYAQAVAVCDRVIATRDLLASVPGNVDIFVDEEQRPKYAKLAAEQFYARGDKLSGVDSTESKQKAAIAFRRANGFVAGFKDALARYETNRDAGTTHMAFGKFKYARGLEFLVNRFQSSLRETVDSLDPEFLKITGKRNPDTNAVLQATIEGSFNDSGWTERPQRNEVTKTRQIGNDEQGQPVYEDYTIRATWVVYTRKTSATLNLSYIVKDEQGNQLDAGTGRMNLKDMKQWVGNFGGDTGEEEYGDAIPYEVQQLPKQKSEPANFRQLTTRMSERWAQKNAPIYKFGHRLYTKFSALRK